MNIPRHWQRERVEVVDATGETNVGVAWGWSADSAAEARARARASAERVAQWLARGCNTQEPPRSFAYQYGLDRPPREEIVQELPDGAGGIAALVSRNVYGALVLNARDLMFIDVDVPQRMWDPAAAAGQLLKRLFGRSAPPPPADPPQLNRLREWCAAHGDYATRIYRTAAGYRAAIVDRPMQAESAEARSILEACGSDPLYRRLCDVQKCFRARLTPKPWRIDLPNPPGAFPRTDAAIEAAYRDWLQTYDAAARQFATCELLETHGRDHIDDSLAPLVRLHDSLTGCERAAPLA